MASIVDGLLPADVVVRTMDPALADPSALTPEEAAAVARAVDKRRRELAAGRQLARAIFAELGRPDVSIPIGERGAPRWPTGYVGSITHVASLAAVAIAPRSAHRSLGLDIEDDAPVGPEVLRTICTTEERRRLAALPDLLARRHARAIFSAKETVYKAQFPLTATFLDFDAVDIELGDDAFVATFRIAAGPFTAGTRWSGRLRRADGLLATALTLPQENG